MSIKPATREEMPKQGFPTELQTAFKETAEATGCVILSRVPGGATTELIAAGHDLKGYFIKAKSCDWGVGWVYIGSKRRCPLARIYNRGKRHESTH